MANYKHVYFGPYMRITKQFKDGIVPVRSCSNTACINFGQEEDDITIKFCSLCGTAYGLIQKQEKVEVPEDLYKLQDEIQETLTECTYEALQDAYRFMIPNIDRGKSRDFSLDVEWKDYCIDEKYIDKGNEINWFKNQFASEIEIYKKACGEKNIEIVWGLFTYSH